MREKERRAGAERSEKRERMRQRTVTEQAKRMRKMETGDEVGMKSGSELLISEPSK